MVIASVRLSVRRCRGVVFGLLDKAGDSPLNHCIYFYIIDVHNGLCRVVAGHPMKKGCDDRYDKQRYHYNYRNQYCTEKLVGCDMRKTKGSC